MKEKETKGVLYKAATAILALLGIATLVPYPSASEGNVLGYLSLCPFAPVSTLICFFGAYTAHGLRIKKETAGSE